MPNYKTIYEKTPLRDRPLAKEIRIKLHYTRAGNVVGTAWVHYKNGQGDYIDNLRAGGYGYDKMGSLIEKVLNTTARQNLLDYEFEAGKPYPKAGVFVSPSGEAYYDMIDSNRGKYFNFDIEETASFNNGDIAQFDIKFKNAMLDKFYGYKTATPKAKKPKCDSVRKLENSVRKMF